jgi:hypothetical protein
MKRLKSVPQTIGQPIIFNHQIPGSILEKCKLDTQMVLPSIIFQKQFFFWNRTIGCFRLIEVFDDFPSGAYSSNIFVRWFVVGFFEKN